MVVLQNINSPPQPITNLRTPQAYLGTGACLRSNRIKESECEVDKTPRQQVAIVKCCFHTDGSVFMMSLNEPTLSHSLAVVSSSGHQGLPFTSTQVWV